MCSEERFLTMTSPHLLNERVAYIISKVGSKSKFYSSMTMAPILLPVIPFSESLYIEQIAFILKVGDE